VHHHTAEGVLSILIPPREPVHTTTATTRNLNQLPHVCRCVTAWSKGRGRLPRFGCFVDQTVTTERTELLFTANPGLTAESGFESAPTKVWRLYQSEADKYDTQLAETWRGQTDAMLIFVRTPYRLGHKGDYQSR